MEHIEKKSIVITGSTRGIGYGMALEFLKRNHQVVINGRNSEKVKEVVRQFSEEGFDVCGVAGNVTMETCHQEILKAAVSHFGKIDIWINNAGIPQTQRLFHELDSREIELVISVNITGVALGTKIAINYFKEQGYGKLFNMEGFGSDGRMMDKLTLYGTSKRAVNYFTKSVSKAEKDHSIQIGILSPGMVRTDFLLNAMATGSAKEQERNQKVLDILAEDVKVVAPFLVEKILVSNKKYDRIKFLTKRRLIPKLVKMIFQRKK